MNKYFLITKADDGGRPILHDAMERRINKLGKKNIRLELNLRKYLYKVVFNPFFYLLVGFFFIKKTINYIFFPRKRLVNINKIEVERYIIAAVLRDPSACMHRSIYIKRYVRYSIKGVYIYMVAFILKNKVEFVYLHDTSYLYGIISDYFSIRGGKVFLKGYPRNIVLCNKKNHNQVSVLNGCEKSNYIHHVMYNKVGQYMKERLSDPRRVISYYRVNANKKIDQLRLDTKLSNVVVIYTHSFTDAQMRLGYDGFNSVYEWLIFTIEALNNQDDLFIILKGHPSFFSKGIEASVLQWDVLIWKEILKKYKNKVNIIIDSTISNGQLLSNLEKSKTVLISHHGNAVIEGAALGFRTISSVCSLWGSCYQFGKLWQSRKEYLECLQVKNWSFSSNKKEAYRFAFDKYMNPKGYHGKDYWLAKISVQMNINIEELIANPSTIQKKKIPNYEAMVRSIEHSIIEL